MTPLPEMKRPTAEDFLEARARGEPFVMRDAVADWPLVRAAREGRAGDWLGEKAGDARIDWMRAPPEVEGRLHYGAGVGGRNFTRQSGTLGDLVTALEAESEKPAPDALALQGLPSPAVIARFRDTHAMPFAPNGVTPRLWIGNAAKVAVHHDPSENVAVVAAGRRRFTVFPPEAVGDLYMGPFHETPAGVQVSMAHVTAPDFERFPRFRQAMEQALTAELGPGDAVYIPYQWYHHVESVEPLNVLVNYWWDPAPRGVGSPWEAMLHGMMSLRTLPPDQRRAWKAMFDHYVFQLDGDPAAHIPEKDRGILRRPTPASIAGMRGALIAALEKDQAAQTRAT